MTILEVKKDLAEALVSLDRDGTLAADCVEAELQNLLRARVTNRREPSFARCAARRRPAAAEP